MIEKILLIGVGDVGKHILEFAAREDRQFEWVIGDIDKKEPNGHVIMLKSAQRIMGNIPNFDPSKLIFLILKKQIKFGGFSSIALLLQFYFR